MSRVATRRSLLHKPTNGLLSALIAYWPGNEESGDALDAHTNALHLTDFNSVTSAAGKVYPYARQYTLANSECHLRAGSDALLTTGNVDYTLAAWLWLDSKSVGSMFGPCKWNTDAQREYGLTFLTTSDRFRFIVSLDGTSSTTLLSEQIGSPSLNTWYLLIGWHNRVAKTINLQINDSAVESVAHDSVFTATSPFVIGKFNPGGGYWNGRIGPTMFWKSAPGNGGVLTAAQRAALYNNGNGLTYAAFTA